MPRTVQLILGVGLLFVAVPLASGEDAKDAKKELEKFQGTWELTAYTVDGKETPAKELKTIKLVVKSDESTLTRGDVSGKGTYKVDPSKKPKELDILLTDGGDKGKTKLCIYEIDGDNLKICLGAIGKERPKEFVSKPGSGTNLEVWKRAKP